MPPIFAPFGFCNAHANNDLHFRRKQKDPKNPSKNGKNGAKTKSTNVKMGVLYAKNMAQRICSVAGVPIY